MRRGSKKNRMMDFWVGIPLLNLLVLFRGRRRNWPERVQRVGVMCSPALGDALLFSAVVQDLRRALPEVEIVHLCMKQNLAAAELIGGVDRRVFIDLIQVAGSVRKIRDERFDVLLDFTSWQRLTAFYSLMSGAKFTAGFSTKGQHRGRGYDLTVEHRNDRHEVENFLAVLRGVGIEGNSEPQLVVPKVAIEPLVGEDDVVVFHPWASGAQSWLREWPEERWIDLARRLAGRDTVFAITGAPSDLERSAPFVRKLEAAGLRAVAFLGKDGFVSLAHLLQRARVVVSVNTGVMHLAAILGAPTVSLNGPTAMHRWGPRGRCVAGVQPADGSGGYLNLGFEFPKHPQDVMVKIAVEDVVKTVESLIERCGRRVHPKA
jgi:heptosyltransferase-3